MSDNSRLSSEQALDDYFFDLLDDSFVEEAPVVEASVSEAPVDEAPAVEGCTEPAVDSPLTDDKNDTVAVSDTVGDVESAGDADADVYTDTDNAINADRDATQDADEHVPADLPRPDDTALSASVGDVNADQDAPSTPFDFASLDEEDAPLQPALALSPLEVAPSPRASWFDVPAERDDLQRLLSQVSLLAEQTEVEAEVEAPSAEPDDTALSDDWALVMAHDADHAQAVDLVPDSALDITTDAPLSSIEINTVSATEQDMALPDITVQDLSVAETDLSTDLATGIVTDLATGITTDTALASEIEIETKTALATQADADLPPDGWQQQEVLGDEFQALFFEVHGVTFAVPLTELGGIHQLGEVSHLFGRPPWYLGLMTNRDHSLDVVDTARWVMPERLVDDAHRDAYRYLVMLGESRWGLACDSLQGTQTLHEHSVRWREQAGKRPWLAGMVKEKMCALIHVPELIAMLDAGLDVQTTLQQA